MKFFIVTLAMLSLALSAVAIDGYGISSWAGWKPKQITREDCPELRNVPIICSWNKLEPVQGQFEFDQYIGDPLRAAAEQDLHVTVMIWVGPMSPQWIYAKGVPKVMTDRTVSALGHELKREPAFPYYLDPTYTELFMTLIEEFGDYLTALPADLRERIIFLQSAEGSTGDGQPYKGVPLEEKYVISKPRWNEFRLETWKAYQKAIPSIPILVNGDANEERENKWVLDNMDVISLKHGMFSHGYHVSGNVERLEEFETIEREAAKRGKKVLTRGEMDAELFVMGWSNRNIPQAVYWSGLMASHCRLDIWNVPYKALKDEATWPGLALYNKYAGHTNPHVATSAFCALRDGLDASDFERFPVEEYGGRPENRRVMERYMNIAEDYAQYGARMDDPEKALAGGMVNRKRSGSNDVGWGIFPSNYSRFLTQVEPGSGDVGLWNIDDSLYGRFARSFDSKNGKGELRFELDEAFRAPAIKVSVTYLDKGNGRWTISGIKGIVNTNSGEWKTVEHVLNRDQPITLNYYDRDDTIFHLVEVDAVNKSGGILSSRAK